MSKPRQPKVKCIKQDLDTSLAIDFTRIKGLSEITDCVVEIPELSAKNISLCLAENATQNSSLLDPRLSQSIDDESFFDITVREPASNNTLVPEPNTSGRQDSVRQMLFPCAECKNDGNLDYPSFTSMEELEFHLSVQHCVGPCCYWCPGECGANFHTRASMLSHYEDAHSGRGNDELDMIVSAQHRIYNSVIQSVYATIYALQYDENAVEISSTPPRCSTSLLHHSSSSAIPRRSATAIASVEYPIQAFSTKHAQQYELEQLSSSRTSSVGSQFSYLANQPSGSCNPKYKILEELFPPIVETPSTSKMANKQSKNSGKAVTTKNKTKESIWSVGLEPPEKEEAPYNEKWREPKSISELTTRPSGMGGQILRSAKGYEFRKMRKMSAFTNRNTILFACSKSFCKVKVEVEKAALYSDQLQVDGKFCYRLQHNHPPLPAPKDASDEEQLQCAECPYKCKNEQPLKDHMKRHQGKLKYSCRHCTYSAPKQGSMMIHEQLHKGLKPQFSLLSSEERKAKRTAQDAARKRQSEMMLIETNADLSHEHPPADDQLDVDPTPENVFETLFGIKSGKCEKEALTEPKAELPFD
ncbi:histone-lysine N-methyltransferase PRDM9-like isoform X2 [Ditylenchus destructor]|nr:histone-lysine N-methyltransferase PRDM9-like isoform X2 [Ditylenchus destructor]